MKHWTLSNEYDYHGRYVRHGHAGTGPAVVLVHGTPWSSFNLRHIVKGLSVEVTAGHAGPAYGVPHAATWDAIALAGRLEALVLDPVYTGKALAGLIAVIKERRWTNRDNVVFVHTGGTPGVFAYASQFLRL